MYWTGLRGLHLGSALVSVLYMVTLFEHADSFAGGGFPEATVTSQHIRLHSERHGGVSGFG